MYSVSENYIQGPHDLNISVGETATFTCEFNFTIQHTLWYLNYTPVQHFSVLNVQEYLHISAKDNLITSEISFLASSEAEPILNNSLLLCQGISSADNIYAVSQPAKLMLQGTCTYIHVCYRAYTRCELEHVFYL